ncbi:nucleotidyl transferase AbiEii/AbiGii toxin family protein [Paraburkholderia sp.]|uniref:nucleotidyl transferase AbiEii/AbiGii toxin family protein n=1 Tax=Paraburkholderia sp. TaxID=1926495 RepID=UPI002390D2A8|nr:nucleotidyl transferase AbiEii/AbiGii toxin family protein [Paraburkholderia sp.]MDE1179349.1 nucleotidyl transferase AbiEii/AbiGii toxin family protein [Paraburkholderia sp.]
MNSISPRTRLEVSDARPLHPTTLALLGRVCDTTRELGAACVVAGATARDILLWHVYGQRPDRATRDVDVAVCAVSWDAHEAFIAALEGTGLFARDRNAQQRLMFRDPETGRPVPLDLVPFGQIEQPEGSIGWPPAGETVMRVLGFQEAFDTAVDVEVDAGLVVPVVTLPALAVLKLLAWQDRRAQSNKDASDLLLLLRHYLDAGNAERIWEVGGELLRQHGFDLTLAAAGLLGQDARRVVLPPTFDAIEAILGDRARYALLESDLIARAAGQMFDAVDGSEDVLRAFRNGFLDPT